MTDSQTRVPLKDIKPQTDAVITSFFDAALSMKTWYPTLDETSAPTPDTVLINLPNSQIKYLHMSKDELAALLLSEDTDSKLDFYGRPDVSFEKIQACIHSDFGGGPVFLRSFYKSARHLGDAAGKIEDNTTSSIKDTLAELFDDHLMQKMPHGRGIAIREYLDIDFKPGRGSNVINADETFHPEVRFFIEDGEILYHYPRMNKDRFEHEFGNLELYREQVTRIEDAIPELAEYAEDIADAFTPHSWSVDFLMDTTGDWYCTDMAVNGLYWNEKDSEWHNLSAHEDGNPHNLAQKIGTDLPAPESHPEGFFAWRDPAIETRPQKF